MKWQETKLTKAGITIDDYLVMVDNEEKDLIADIIETRLIERYIAPFEIKSASKSGFSMMAIACLLIETIDCFKEGVDDTRGETKQSFIRFFEKEPLFIDFKSRALDFYSNVRCGLLHQGETKKGWRINRKNDTPLLEGKSINANLFILNLKNVIRSYAAELKASDFNDSRIWTNTLRKMEYILNNCKLS
jgi:hypothetical protein